MKAFHKFQKYWASSLLNITNNFSRNQEQIKFGIKMTLYMLIPWSHDHLTKFSMKKRRTLGGKVTKFSRKLF